MTAIANAIRAKRGISGTLSLDQMATEIENIQTGITPSGTKTITANGTYDVTQFASAEVDTNPIPNLYTKLEYIEASGTQYIDTGVMPTENCTAEIDFALTGYTNRDYIALVSASTHMYLVHFTHSSGEEIKFVPNWFSYSSASSYSEIYKNQRYRSLCHIFNNATPNGFAGGIAITTEGNFSERRYATQTYTPENNFFIFARNNGGGTVSYQAKARLYALKLYTDGILRRDFVPAIRKADSVIGLYDRVSDSFFTNIGTGTFTGQ
ncbi:MAG: hypothetical protein Q3985_05270 [Eubacteriales bacterium]|nr:hypothetical protein [Eubacteriales bacterium]